MKKETALEYFKLRQDIKGIKEDIKKIVDNSPQIPTKEYGERSQIMLDIEYLYLDRKSCVENWGDCILNFYSDDIKTPYEEIEKLINLFVKRKVIKRRLGVLKGTATRELYNLGKKLSENK